MAKGLFYNEQLEGWATHDPFNPYADWVNKTGADLDRGVLSNLLGGAFCPGGEVGWAMRNPAVFLEPYRLKADPDFYAFRQTAAQANTSSGAVSDEEYASYVDTPLSQDNNYDRGLQPGDFTKSMALPWQADFNECTTQDVNITYESWNTIYTENDHDLLTQREAQIWETLWWPAHRPLQVWELVGFSGGQPNFQYLNWARGIPQTNAGDQKMVTEWSKLGFVILNPFLDPVEARKPTTLPPNQKYVSLDRNYREQS